MTIVQKIHPIGDTLNFGLTLRRYQAFGEDAANRFDAAVFRKAFFVDEKLFLFSLFEKEKHAQMAIAPATRAQKVQREAHRIAHKILGLEFPLKEFYAFAQSDAVLRELTTRFRGLRPTLSSDLFEMMITSISAQQINLQFAFAVRSRLVRRYGERLQHHSETYFAFPTPEKLARVRVASLRALQFTEKKSEYIIGLARAICEGKLDLAQLPHLSDEEIAEKLLPLHGIGRWTVDWLLARGLGRGNAIAAGDLGVRKAVQHFYFNGESQTEDTIRSFAARWGNFTNLAVHYLLTGMALGS
jgi:DNA-3-methyladenine glycosylase II